MNYLCDVLRIHKFSRASLISALRPRQWGMAEDTNYRIIAKTLCGNTKEFWPRINDNVALRGNWLGNSGGDNGIAVDSNGNIGFNTKTPGVGALGGADITGRVFHSVAPAGTNNTAIIASGDFYTARLIVAGLCGINTTAFQMHSHGRICFVDKDGSLLYSGAGIYIKKDDGSVNVSRSLNVGDESSDAGDNNIHAIGNVKADGDIYRTAMTDYSAISTISGCTGATTQYIHYKRIGKTIHIWFNIEGVSDGSTGDIFTFTVPAKPYNNVAGYWFPVKVMDNNVVQLYPGLASVSFGSGNVCYITKDFNQTGFTKSGNKKVFGYICYETV